MEKREHLAILDIIKICCAVLIYMRHSITMFGCTYGSSLVDGLICATTSPIMVCFFVVSGFLVSYNYSNKMVPATWNESCLYVKKKLSKMWSLHFVAFFICLSLMPISDIFSMRTAFEALINLFLLQSWSIDSRTFFSFNGTSWFLSSILFCYFLSPFLLKTANTRRRAVISL